MAQCTTLAWSGLRPAGALDAPGGGDEIFYDPSSLRIYFSGLHGNCGRKPGGQSGPFPPFRKSFDLSDGKVRPLDS